jgi:hypothetical protein
MSIHHMFQKPHSKGAISDYTNTMNQVLVRLWKANVAAEWLVARFESSDQVSLSSTQPVVRGS